MFAHGDNVVCIISDIECILVQGMCYTVIYSNWNLVRLEGIGHYFDPLRFRLATPLNKALS